MPKHWIEQVDTLSPAALTVRAQAIDATDRGQLKWETFFPRVDVPSTELQDVMTLNDRFVSDRREWNAQGRQIPLRAPDLRKMEFTPITAYQKIGEKELNKMASLQASVGNTNASTVATVIGYDLPSRVDGMALANSRRIELDAVNAWTSGKVVQVNPETGATYDISFSFDAGRITTVATAWTAGGVNAYNEFVAAAKDAQEAFDVLAGAVMRRSVLTAILEDSPVNAISGKKLKLAELAQDISDEMGTEFTIGVWEDSVDVFTDGGTTTSRTKVFPDATLAFIPAGGAIGKTAFAPVYRARSIAAAVPEAGIDINGQTVFYVTENDGMILKPTVQVNAFPVPDEDKLFVLKGLV